MRENNINILDNMPQMIVMENEVGIIRYVNKAFCECHGGNPEDAVGKSIFDYIIPEDREKCNVENIVAPENPYYRIEGRSIRKDGKIIWIQYVGKAFFDGEGNRTGFEETGVDITEWKEKIEESAKELAAANNIIDDFNNHIDISQHNKIDSRNGKFPAMYKFTDIYTQNPRMKGLLIYAKSVALGNATILIEGESGTGKELIAQAIHNESKRANGPFVAMNCGAIPAELIASEFFGYVEGAFTGAVKGGKPGKFEMASGGTLFLDEIGEMPITQQISLLRVLETKMITRVGDHKQIPVDVRIICATNRNLREEVKEGRFRSDLYYRLNVINLRIPPLRERKEDIFPLVGKFIKKYGRHRFSKEKAFTDENIMALYEYDWPGNVRELQNVVERLMYLPDDTGDEEAVGYFESIIEEFRRERPDIEKTNNYDAKNQTGESKEKNILISLLGECEGNISMMARRLGVSRNTVYKRLEYYGLKRPK